MNYTTNREQPVLLFLQRTLLTSEYFQLLQV